MKRKLNISTIIALIAAILLSIAGIFYIISDCINHNFSEFVKGLAFLACSVCWFFIFSTKLNEK